MADPVVILDRNGVEHEFPAGFDPTRAAGIVRESNDRMARVEEHRRILADTPERPSFLSLAGTTLGQAAKSLVSAPVNLARTVSDVAQEVGSADPIRIGMGLTRRLLIDPAVAQGRKAIGAGRQGRVSEAVGHSAAALLPMVGPAAANISEQIGTGDPETMARGVGDAVALAAAPGAMRVAGRIATRTGQALQSGGRSAFLRAAKIPESVSKRTNAYRKTGDLAAGEQEIAGTLLSRGRGGISRANAAAVNAERQAANAAIGEAVEQVSGVPSTPILRAMANEVRKMRREQDPSANAGAARYRQMRQEWSETVPEVRPSGPIMTTRGPQTAAEASVEGFGQYQPIRIRGRLRPRALTGRELQDFNVGTGTRNANRFAQRGEPTAPAVSRVDMAGGAAGRASLRTRSGELARASDTSSALKPALQALLKASQRSGHTNPLSLPQAVLGAGAMSAFGPQAALLALLPILQRSGPLSRIGQGMYTSGGLMSRTGAPIANANQAALLAQMLEQAQAEP